MPTFGKAGTHVNVSGAALAKHAPNRANAVKLWNFWSRTKAQQIYAEANYEYPVKAGAQINPISRRSAR